MELSPEPRLFVVARNTVDWAGVRGFLTQQRVRWTRVASVREQEHLVELAGRLCYMSFGALQSPKTNGQYVAHLIRQGHESVLEHAWWSFILTGVSRSFTHQFVRHRVGFAFSQLSQQYHDESGTRFVLPKAIGASAALRARWERHMSSSLDLYAEIAATCERRLAASNGMSTRELKRAMRSAARSVLANASETALCFSANARAIRHFLKLRGSLGGDHEMREVSSLLYDAVSREAGALFADFRSVKLKDGSRAIKHDPSLLPRAPSKRSVSGPSAVAGGKPKASLAKRASKPARATRRGPA